MLKKPTLGVYTNMTTYIIIIAKTKMFPFHIFEHVVLLKIKLIHNITLRFVLAIIHRVYKLNIPNAFNLGPFYA